jgi:hypothetical protein
VVGDVLLALHLDQRRDGGAEREGAVSGNIDVFGPIFGRGDQQGARLVECVDQDVETPGRVAPFGAEPRDRFDDDRREALDDREIVGGWRCCADLGEAEPGDR